MNVRFPPIRIGVVYLGLLSLVASWLWAPDSLTALTQMVLRVALLWFPGWFLYRGLLWRGRAVASRWEHRFFTVAILFLLFDPLNPWWVLVLLSLSAEAIQRWWRVPTGPVLNPAAAAALLVSVVTGWYPSWWGTNTGPLPVLGMDNPFRLNLAALLTVFLMGWVVWSYRKTSIVVSGLASSALLFLLLFRFNPVFLILDGTLLFFLMVMAVEPKTSPVQARDQFWFGIGLGALMILGMRWSWPEPYTIALLAMNLLWQGYRYRALLRTRLGQHIPNLRADKNGVQQDEQSTLSPGE